MTSKIRRVLKFIPNELTSSVLPYMEAKRRAEAAFEREYLARVMTLAKGNETDAARLSGIKLMSFRRLLRRNGLSPPELKKAQELKKPRTAKHTDTIVTILGANPHGLRTYEIAEQTQQKIGDAFNILKLLRRQGRIERHGERYNTLWSLPGIAPIPRVETIPAAAIAVLSKAGPMNARHLRDEMCTLLRGLGKPASAAALRRAINRLISAGTLTCYGTNEDGVMYALASKGNLELN